MAIFNPRRFAQPDKLKEISHSRLLQFFHPFRDYLEGRGLEFPTNGGRIDHFLLASILMSPKDNTPDDMVDAIYFIHEMATAEGMNRLLEAAHGKGLALDDDPNSTPADVAVQVWLLDRQLLEAEHAKVLVTNPRSFIYFSGRYKGWQFQMPSDETIRALESDMDDWFEKRRRGRGCNICVFEQAGKVNLLIRHGRPPKREEAFNEGGGSSSMLYRPEKHDVVVYDKDQVELAVNAETKGEREMYVLMIGRHLFRDETFFPGEEKYTMEPLMAYGRDAMVCGDIDGLEWVRLRELSIQRRGRTPMLDVKKSVDVFSAMEERCESLSRMDRLVMATFEFKLENISRPRMVTIRSANNLQYTRDEDNGYIVEEWMSKRGFIRGMEGRTGNENVKAAMARSGGAVIAGSAAQTQESASSVKPLEKMIAPGRKRIKVFCSQADVPFVRILIDNGEKKYSHLETVMTGYQVPGSNMGVSGFTFGSVPSPRWVVEWQTHVVTTLANRAVSLGRLSAPITEAINWTGDQRKRLKYFYDRPQVTCHA
ncbi:MAG: hypothetical protein H7835_19245 [Magnetococcus sp. XQGC-1]